MNFKDIKTNAKGFTIVELLIVVVVIAILAAITIVSYNGITTQANDSAAKSLASNWQKKAELYFADKGTYPIALDQMEAPSEPYHMPASSHSATAPNNTNGTTHVQVEQCGGTGIEINYWGYSDDEIKTLPVGVTTSCTVMPATEI